MGNVALLLRSSIIQENDWFQGKHDFRGLQLYDPHILMHLSIILRLGALGLSKTLNCSPEVGRIISEHIEDFKGRYLRPAFSFLHLSNIYPVRKLRHLCRG